MTINEQEFQEYIQQREESKKQKRIKFEELRNVIMPFGKYKGQRVSMIQDIEDRRHGEVGKQYLSWVFKNVEIKDVVLKEAVEFYKDYYYLHGDGYD